MFTHSSFSNGSSTAYGSQNRHVYKKQNTDVYLHPSVWSVLKAGIYSINAYSMLHKHQVWNFKLTRKPLGPLVPAGPVAPGGPWQTKVKEENKEERRGGERKKRKIKQRFTLTEHRAPGCDPGGQPDLRNTLWGLLLDLSLTPIKGPVLESCSAEPLSPVFMFVLVAPWPPHLQPMARTQQGEMREVAGAASNWL